MSIKFSYLALAATWAFASTAHAEGEWRFGVGTGMVALNIEGDAGFNTLLGPVLLELDLDAEDIADVLESAIGIGGFASNGQWTISYMYQNMELGGGGGGTVLGGLPVAASTSLEVTAAEVTVAYRFAEKGRHTWGALAGGRYLEHKYDVDLVLGAAAFNQKLEKDWTDMLLGVTHAYAISPKLAWTSRADYGFGGSEGTLFLYTGLSWHISDRFTAAFFAQRTAQDFEDNDPGDPDWYLYDSDEFGLGLNVLVTW